MSLLCSLIERTRYSVKPGVLNSLGPRGHMNSVCLALQAWLSPEIHSLRMPDPVQAALTPAGPGLHCMWCLCRAYLGCMSHAVLGLGSTLHMVLPPSHPPMAGGEESTAYSMGPGPSTACGMWHASCWGRSRALFMLHMEYGSVLDLGDLEFHGPIVPSNPSSLLFIYQNVSCCRPLQTVGHC